MSLTKATVKRSDPRISVHELKGMLLVTSVAPLFVALAQDFKKQLGTAIDRRAL